jgi:HEAT repeat protein
MASLTSIAVELRGLVGTAIPQIIDLLQHDDWYTRKAGVGALSKLSEQGM